MKEAIMARVKLLSEHMPRGAAENCNTFPSGQPVSWPRFEAEL